MNFFCWDLRLSFNIDNPSLGVFGRNILYILFLAQRGYKGFTKVFRMKKHGHISLWIMIAWFSERLTVKQNLTTSNMVSFYFFILFLVFFVSYLLLRSPLRVFSLTDFLYIFYFKRLWRLEIEIIFLLVVKTQHFCPDIRVSLGSDSPWGKPFSLVVWRIFRLFIYLGRWKVSSTTPRWFP